MIKHYFHLPSSAVYINSRTNPMGIDVFSVNQLEIMIPQRIRKVSCTDPDKRLYQKEAVAQVFFCEVCRI